MTDQLNQPHRERATLKLHGRVHEMIPLQMKIISETEKLGRIVELANAWNYLSALYHKVCDYKNAEHAAKKALEVYGTDPAPSAETLGTYQFKLAQILAAQQRFEEAVPMAEAGVRSYAVFHNPSDDFLIARQAEVTLMREYMERSASGDTTTFPEL